MVSTSGRFQLFVRDVEISIDLLYVIELFQGFHKIQDLLGRFPCDFHRILWEHEMCIRDR